MPQVTKGVPSESSTMRGDVMGLVVESTTIESDHCTVLCATPEKLERMHAKKTKVIFIMLIENIEPAAYTNDPSLVINLKLGPSDNSWTFIFVPLFVEYAARHQPLFSGHILLALD